MPGEERGRIFSITEKNSPEVVGDGRSTLEELVLADRRAVAIARVYRAELGSRRDAVPAAGERVKLIDIGTHARGSIFLDGTRHSTAALETAVDELSRSVEGFCFGRYDVRVAGVADLEQGRELHGARAQRSDRGVDRHLRPRQQRRLRLAQARCASGGWRSRSAPPTAPPERG